MKVKVIISTFGPLHLIKGAEVLSPFVNIRVIQGWLPNRFNNFLLRIASKLVGRDLSKTIKKRTPSALIGRNKSIALPEFILWICKVILKLKSGKIELITSSFYGLLTKKYIVQANIFHVRSGSGLGGAIEKAIENGMKVVVDHSIAHPAFMDKQLRKEYLKNNVLFDLGLDSVFWQGVLCDCKKADCILVNSSFVKDTFIAQGYNENKIKVAYLGVRHDFFSLKQNYSAKESIKILFTGSFNFRKGAEYILKALVKLDNLNFQYEMTVVGSYQGASELINKYKPHNINFVPHIPQNELKKYLAMSDIYLFPSLAEGCASSGMEAMAAGLPVISTHESGLPIINGENGILIPAKNIEQIVEKIKELSYDIKLREILGANAASTIANNYTWEKYAKNVVSIYNELLN